MYIHLGSSLIDEKHPKAKKMGYAQCYISWSSSTTYTFKVSHREVDGHFEDQSQGQGHGQLRSKSRSKSSSTTYSFSKSHWEVDGHFEVHTIPVHLQQDTQLLSTAQRKHWDQNLKIKVKVKVKVTERSCRFNLSHVVTYCVYYIEPDILVSIVLGNGLVPDGTKPLPNQCKLIINKIFLNMSMHY